MIQRLQLGTAPLLRIGGAYRLVDAHKHIVLAIAYNSFDGIISPFIREFSWVYPLAFLALAIMTMYTLFITLYRNIDKITDLITENVAKLPREK